MIRTKLAKLHISPISLYAASSVLIPSSVNNFGTCCLPLGYLLLGHLLSGSILNYLRHSKGAECILMFLSAMPRGVSAAHIYVLNFHYNICKRHFKNISHSPSKIVIQAVEKIIYDPIHKLD